MIDMDVKLGRFGHHPDPAIDFCVEVETLQGELFDRACGLAEGRLTYKEMRVRFDAALSFIVGGDLNAIAAKDELRALDRELRHFESLV